MTATIESTLTDVGAGLGAFFDSIAVPITTLLILLGIATGIGLIFMAIAKRIGRGMD
jgi:hypothetical protein